MILSGMEEPSQKDFSLYFCLGSDTLVKQFGHLMQPSPARVHLLLATNGVKIRIKRMTGYTNLF